MGGDSVDLQQVVDDLVDSGSQPASHLRPLVQRQVQKLPDELTVHDQAVRVGQFRRGMFHRSVERRRDTE